jgi:DNA (cytosine-5)-methyltransferase 1
MLVLSLFPGIDLLGRGFEAAGCTVVRGPDQIFGQDVRGYHVPPGRFDGVIGGSPCQGFSLVNRTPDRAQGIAMLREWARLVFEAQPPWALLENVPTVPDVAIQGYCVQRFNLDARECGLRQRRLRRFQFFSRDAAPLILRRRFTVSDKGEATVLTRDKRDWATICALQGLPEGFNLPGWPLGFAKKCVGNGVPVPMAQFLAESISERAANLSAWLITKVCVCGCGREIKGRRTLAADVCKKRVQIERDNPREKVTWPGVRAVTASPAGAALDVSSVARSASVA